MDERPGLTRGRHELRSVIVALAIVSAACTGRVNEQSTQTPSPPVTTAPAATATPAPTAGPDAHGNPMVLIASGDIACAPGSPAIPTGCHQATTASLVAGGPGGAPVAVLLLGDTQYESGRTQDYASFDMTWGAALRALPGTAVLPVAGNHEWYDPDPTGSGCVFQHAGRNACGFESYFGDAAFAGELSDGVGDYARTFAAQTAHPLAVIMLDVGVCEHDPAVCSAGSRTTSFLERALADPQVNPPAACTIVAWHQARWSDAGHGDIGYVDPVWRALYRTKPAQRPDLVVNGHDHLYERMPALGTGGRAKPDGIVEIVAGAGGREIAGVSYAGPAPTRAAFVDLQHFGVLRMEADTAAGSLRTALLTESGTLLDEQLLTCR
ncbi:MAG: hypothetical protein ABJB55_00195 [Actinomycetota bacterium]